MLDFDAMIAAHRAWKDRIRASILAGTAIDPASIARDDQCDLGRWILARQAVLGANPEFQFLRDQHTRFHRVASETVKTAAGLPQERALALLEVGTPYNTASAACVSAIVALRTKVGATV
ncbi:MAG: CZB domain-containing protein [Gemmatimonadales bacterium]|nr:CZB domain-containing protein [Gemmatimonadales bacterium]